MREKMNDAIEIRLTLDADTNTELQDSLSLHLFRADWDVARLIHNLIDIHLIEWRREKEIIEALNERAKLTYSDSKGKGNG